MQKNDQQEICLTIAGLDPSGGAGIIADIKTFSAFECFATSAITSITFQNTQGVYGAEHQTAESVSRQVEPILDDYDVSAVKTGMLPTLEVIDEVANIIEKHKLRNLVVDPVVRSTSGFDLIDDSALRSMISKVFPLAKIITPNIPEAERISQMNIRSENDIKKSAEIMRELGAENVLVKGGHFEGAKSNETDRKMARDFLFIGEELKILEAEYIETTATHGTGCTLAAAITANLALGKELYDAVKISKAFVHEAIKAAPKIGKGHSPINPMH